MEMIAEAAASPSIARAYELIRSELGSEFVPSIYQVLAMHPPALDAAVQVLPQIVALARDNDFQSRACATAAVAINAVAGDATPQGVTLDAESRNVIEGYRSANPFNLLLTLALLGTRVPEWPGVMTADRVSNLVASDEALALSDQITRAHGGVLLPGLWRGLLAISRAEEPWSEVRAFAAHGHMPALSAQVRSAAEQVLREAGVSTDDDLVGMSLTHELPHLAWFPTGIATMIVEAELLVSNSSNTP